MATDPLGHDYIESVIAPTWDDGGYTLHKCSRCGDEYVTDEVASLRDQEANARVSLAGASVTVPSLTYSGAVQSPAVKVELGGKVLSSRTDYTLSFRDAKGSKISTANVKAAGSYQVVVTGKGNYTGAVVKPFKVNRASITKATFYKIKVQTLKKTGKAVEPKLIVKFAGKTLKKGVDYTLVYKNNKKVGTASVVVKGKGSFSGSKTIKFKIASKKSAKAVKSQSTEGALKVAVIGR